MSIVQDMVKSGITVTNVTYMALAEGYIKTNQFTSLMNVIRQSFLTKSPLVYEQLFTIYLHLWRKEQANLASKVSLKSVSLHLLKLVNVFKPGLTYGKFSTLIFERKKLNY